MYTYIRSVVFRKSKCGILSLDKIWLTMLKSDVMDTIQYKQIFKPCTCTAPRLVENIWFQIYKIAFRFLGRYTYVHSM